MKIEINLDLEAALASALSPEKLSPILDKHLAQAITSAISDATGYRSPFAETLKEQLGEMLPHGLKLDDVAKFQQVLNHSLRDLVHGMNAEAVNAALRKVAAEALPEVPAVVKLSELLKEARDRFHKEEHEAFYAFWKPADYGGGWLYLDDDPRPGSSSSYRSFDREDVKHNAKHRLAVTKEGEVYALRLSDRQVTPASRPDVIGHFDSILMAMYVGRTRLEIDMDDDEVESAAAEQYD